MVALTLLSTIISYAAADSVRLPGETQSIQQTESASSSANLGIGSTSRRTEMEVNFRGRYLTVPKAFMNPFFFDPETDNTPYEYAQPRIQAFTVGAEYVLKLTPLNWIFYYEY